MLVLDFELLAAAPVATEPYAHFVAGSAIKGDAAPFVLKDFPDIGLPGTVAVDDIPVVGAFADLVADLRSSALTELMSDKLGLDLKARPIFINMCKWSKRSDGRIHTDSVSKVATFLVYLNTEWSADTGCLRVLRNGHDMENYAREIRPVLGNAFGFRRSDNSWHGFKSFSGERRMIQTTWLVDDTKIAHKRKAGRRANWLRRLNPFLRTPLQPRPTSNSLIR